MAYIQARRLTEGMCPFRPSVLVALLLLLCFCKGKSQMALVSNEQALLSALQQGFNITIMASITLTTELTLGASLQIIGADTCEGGCTIFVKENQRHITIWGPDTKVSIQGLTLKGGSAEHGGSILIGRGATVTFVRMTFSGNSATGVLQGGGAIHVAGQSNVYILSSTFEGNNGSFGGALEIVGMSNVTVSQSTFIQNSAKFAGGAINLMEGSSLIFQKSSIVNSVAPIGGAINVANASATICSSTTTDNVAAINDHGPAVLAGRSADVSLCQNTTEQVTCVRGGRWEYDCRSCSPLPGRGHHPRGRGHHPPGVGKHAPRRGHHKNRTRTGSPNDFVHR